ncbi:MAG: hypothetical protein M1834_002533 [Cirrosporium novae-zelandiae]|nr:MAG: hypothetical protein M1834_002533 [Cirrosporium novae-zelandiae]
MTEEAGPSAVQSLDEVLATLESHMALGQKINEGEDNSNGEGTDLGMEALVKTLYEGPLKCNCCVNWVEIEPDDLKESVEETSDAKRHALVVKIRKSHSGTKSTHVDQIVVQSPLLKNFLQRMINDYPGVTLGSNGVTFSKPFTPFFHNWDNLEKASDNHDDSKTREHIKLLFQTLKKELKATINTHEIFTSHGVITFDYLWTLFKPGDIVYQRRHNHDWMYRLLRYEYDTNDNTPSFDLQCAYIDWDGSKFGFAVIWVRIMSFNSTKPITELDVYPSCFIKSRDCVRERILNRGKTFQSLKDHHYRAHRAEFLVEDISNIVWNNDSFDRLVLPESYKKTILTFVNSQISQDYTLDDIIEGKVAEKLRTPLYAVTAGELGSNANDIEKRLSTILEIVAKWKAVLLLDKADVFLEQRSNHDLERKKLVAIFLRTLEYYKGILLITTNRSSSFAKAFQSRIHLSLKYLALSTESQKKIWRNFINPITSKETEFSDDDLAASTRYQMNGREIKNAVKMACLVAAQDQEAFAAKHVHTILGVLHGDPLDGSVDA